MNVNAGSSSTTKLRVLVLTPTGRDSEITVSVLRDADIDALTVENVEDLWKAASAGAGAAVIAEEALTPRGLSAIAEAIATQPPWSDFPFVILATHGRGSPESRLALAEMGAITNATVLERPLRKATLVSAVRVALRSRERQYELQSFLLERERMEERREEMLAQQKRFVHDVLMSVTDGRLCLCQSEEELPPLLDSFGPPIPLSRSGGMADLRHKTTEACKRAHLSTECCYDMETAVGEAAMNAVVHAGCGMGEVFVDNGTRVQIRVKDHGKGISQEQLPKATLARGYSTKETLGHGFKMMLQTADRVYLLTGPGGTTVIIEGGSETERE